MLRFSLPSQYRFSCAKRSARSAARGRECPNTACLLGSPSQSPFRIIDPHPSSDRGRRRFRTRSSEFQVLAASLFIGVGFRRRFGSQQSGRLHEKGNDDTILDADPYEVLKLFHFDFFRALWASSTGCQPVVFVIFTGWQPVLRVVAPLHWTMLRFGPQLLQVCDGCIDHLPAARITNANDVDFRWARGLPGLLNFVASENSLKSVSRTYRAQVRDAIVPRPSAC